MLLQSFLPSVVDSGICSGVALVEVEVRHVAEDEARSPVFLGEVHLDAVHLDAFGVANVEALGWQDGPY